MSRTAVCVALTLGSVMSLAAPAAASDLPPTSQLAPDQRSALGQKYLQSVCPTGPVTERLLAEFKRTWGERRFVRYGTPQPKALRVQYGKVAKANAREARKLAATSWPSDIAPSVRLVIRESRSQAAYFASRTTPTVSRSWKKDYFRAGDAGATIRSALGLPPPGEGC